MKDFIKLLEKRRGNLCNLLENSCEKLALTESQKIAGAIDEIGFFISVVEKMHELEILHGIDQADSLLNNQPGPAETRQI